MKKHTKSKEEKAMKRRRNIIAFVLALLISTGVFFINRSPIVPIITFFSVIIVLALFFYFKDKLEKSARSKKLKTFFQIFYN
jgi:hypothetical protein